MCSRRDGSLGIVLALTFVLGSLGSPSAAAAQRHHRHHRQEVPGTLDIRGPYAGAEVFIDGDSKGHLPMDPIGLEPGEHAVRVSLPGYTELTEVATVHPGRRTVLEVNLMAVSMIAHVASQPTGAQVFVDGRFAGNTPVDLDMVEGGHSVRIHEADYRDVVRHVDAVAGHHDTIQVTLTELSADERPRIIIQPKHPTWYTRPLTWVLVGGGAVAVAATVVLILALTSSGPSALDQFCKPSGDACIRIGL